jgi:cell division cycle 20-like protein 1, cofactor of APC complex
MGAVYIWSAHTSSVKKLCEVDADDAITSVSWSQRGNHLAVGTHKGATLIWDTVHCKLVRQLAGHTGRVSSIAWNTSTVSTGSRDKTILSRDLRSASSLTQKLVGHKQEVCGLKWSFDNSQLASGGNDNKLCLWSPHSLQPLTKFT